MLQSNKTQHFNNLIVEGGPRVMWWHQGAHRPHAICSIFSQIPYVSFRVYGRHSHSPFPFQLVSYHASWSTGVRVSFKATWTGPLPLRRTRGCIRWWGSGCEVMEGWWKDEVIKECKVDEGGCDGMAASWSPGQPLNSESTLLIMTCQGCE